MTQHLPATGRRLLWASAFVAGLVATWYASVAVVHRVEGFDPEIDELASDCDDCGLTVLLDGIEWLVAGFAVYALVVLVVWQAARRRARRQKK